MVLGEQENKQKRPVPFFRLSKTKKKSGGSFRGSVHCVGYNNYTLKISIFQRKTGILMT